MSTATPISTPSSEEHDAPRTTPPRPQVAARETAKEPQIVDAPVDDRYDNVACTD